MRMILAVMVVLVIGFVSIKMGHDISASILLTGCIVSMALLEIAKAIRGE